MKLFAKTILLASVLMMTSWAQANSFTEFFSDLRFYLGGQYKWTNLGGREDFKDILPRSFHHGGFYLGARFNENWGAEAGWDIGLKKTKDERRVGTAVFGTPLGAGNTLTTRIKMHLEDLRLDGIGYLPVKRNINLLAILGVGYIKPKFGASVALSGPDGTLVDDELRTIYGERRAVWRVGPGIEFTESHWTVRVKVLYEGTGQLRVQNGINAGIIPSKAFSDSIAVNVGAHYTFSR